MKKATVVCAFMLCMAGIRAQEVKMYPVNELHKDSSLTNFICKLQYAVFKKDTTFLLSVIDKNIKNTFGDGIGIADFKNRWKLGSDSSSVWYFLSRLISMGGMFTPQGTGFVLPYVYYQPLPNDTLDIFSVMVVTGENVNVHQKPGINSPIVGQLTYDVVEMDYAKSYSPEKRPPLEEQYSDKEWYYVTTLDKKLSGFVDWEYLWSPIDYRIFFAKENGRWKIVAFVAGD